MRTIPARFKPNALLTGILLACSPLAASAVEEEVIRNNRGEDVFLLGIFSPTDDPSLPFAFDDNDRTKIRAALERWANILTPGKLPVRVALRPMNEYNANAYSPDEDDPLALALDRRATFVQLMLNNALSGPVTQQEHAEINIGTLEFDTAPVTPSQLPLTGQVDYAATVYHEMAHALGISNSVVDRHGQDTFTPYFPYINRWSAGLRDDHGNPAKEGQDVLCIGCNTPYSSEAFDLRQDKGYFTGAHVQEVLDGAMPGIPVSILSDHDHPEYGIDNNYMSHTELRNSLMSHQTYRNYTTLMEAEIAALQDMGLQIDRRNFFGYSVYGNDGVLANTHGYFDRNAEGSDYLPGTYNRAYQGLGLHIYGERNTVTQMADLLSTGDGGVGVRIDGSQNTLFVPQGTRIHANGWYGRGIQVSYGREQSIIQQGEVRANGQDGVGVLFDFGSAALGNDTAMGEYRGSWMRTHMGSPVRLLDELQGALVSRYDLSGTVSGKAAAIRISDNAWVQNIHVMQGARIEGDIVSDYDWNHPVDGSRLTTRLSFGQKADALGRSTAAVDPSFQMRYDGNIRGATSFDVVMAGGKTSLNGNHALHSLRIEPGATLLGNSAYSIHSEGVFANYGTLRPGNSFGSVQIAGNFVQGASGTTVIEANTTQHDRVQVTGQAQLGGELQLQLLPDWYASGWSLAQGQVFSASSQTGAFDRITASLASPTLSVTTNGNGWSVQRTGGAYARYAANPNAAAVGRSLEGANVDAQRPLASLYQGLDFSRADGSEVRSALDQLGSGAYGAQLAASLRREQLVSEQLQQRKASSQPGWQSFAQIYGGTYRWQQGSGDVDHRSNTYGLLIGADQQSSGSDWRWGVHASVNTQRVNMSSSLMADGRMDSLAAGLHALYRPDANAGWSATGQWRVGVEDGRLNRQQSFGGYSANSSSTWTSHYMAAGMQARYQWQLGDSGSIGPVLGLDYLHYKRPGITESGSALTRLKLDAAKANSLQASLGVALRHQWQPSAGKRLSSEFAVTWEQALLGSTQSQYAAFAASPQLGFESDYARVNRNALALRAGLNYQASDRLSMGLTAATRVLADSRAEFSGNLALRWAF